MKRLSGCLVLLLGAVASGCYSHTKEVVVREQTATPPAQCAHAQWVPPTAYTSGYWRCTM